jgi:hypothetical protein
VGGDKFRSGNFIVEKKERLSGTGGGKKVDRKNSKEAREVEVWSEAPERVSGCGDLSAD